MDTDIADQTLLRPGRVSRHRYKYMSVCFCTFDSVQQADATR